MYDEYGEAIYAHRQTCRALRPPARLPGDGQHLSQKAKIEVASSYACQKGMLV